jgi:hypothetical protein
MTDSWGRHGSNIQHGADVSVHVIPTCRARCGTEKQGTGAGRWDLPVGEDVNRERWDEEGKYLRLQRIEPRTSRFQEQGPNHWNASTFLQSADLFSL